VLSLLYDGIMPAVLLCWDLQMEKDVAIKIPTDGEDFQSNAEMVIMEIIMLSEAQMLPNENFNLGDMIDGKFSTPV